MTQNSSYPDLPCQALIYRLGRSKTFVDAIARKFTPAAFMRRPPTNEQARGDEDGLSVNPVHTCSLEDAKSGFNGTVLAKVHGVATLHVGRVRDIGLNVIQDDEQHGLITRLPYATDDLVEANRLASALADQSRLVWPDA